MLWITARVQALVDAREMNSQNAFSVAVAFLGGSIMARPRGFLLRTIFPIATGLGAAAYFMPNTVNNVDQAWYRCAPTPILYQVTAHPYCS